MNWNNFKRLASKLFQSLDNEHNSEKALQEMMLAVNESPSHPYHLDILFQEVEKYQKKHHVESNRINFLDHGCGGGLTLMYLMLRGYTQCWGVDLNFGHDIKALNNLLKRHFKIKHDVFSDYPGDKLNFPDCHFDIIFSQQVLEHVNDKSLPWYISEESRVLKLGGVAYHQIPQRLTPWDSHTRLWIVHYFPGFIRRILYSVMKQDPDYVELILNFKSKFYYLNNFKKKFTTVSDMTLKRVRTMPDFSTYEGNFKLRKLITQMASMPVIGHVLSTFVMMDMVAIKE